MLTCIHGPRVPFLPRMGTENSQVPVQSVTSIIFALAVIDKPRFFSERRLLQNVSILGSFRKCEASL